MRRRRGALHGLVYLYARDEEIKMTVTHSFFRCSQPVIAEIVGQSVASCLACLNTSPYLKEL